MNISPLLAADALHLSTGNGSDIVHGFIAILIIAVCCLIVWALGRYLGTTFKAPPIAFVIWNVLFVCIGAIVILNFLLSLIGRGYSY